MAPQSILRSIDIRILSHDKLHLVQYSRYETTRQFDFTLCQKEGQTVTITSLRHPVEKY
jgi:hypothetical protein